VSGDRIKLLFGQRLPQMKLLRLVLGSNGKTSWTTARRSATLSMKMQKDLTKQQNPDTQCREVNCYANGCFHPTYSDLSLAGYHSEVYQ
jgi:hypothetical protein